MWHVMPSLAVFVWIKCGIKFFDKIILFHGGEKLIKIISAQADVCSTEQHIFGWYGSFSDRFNWIQG